MITEYHRPVTIDEALALLSRNQLRTIPIGGGTSIPKKGGPPIAVVDLQALPLGTITSGETRIEIGAMARMAELLPKDEIPQALKDAILRDLSSNQRQMATLGGCVCALDGRSSILTCLLALDAQLIWEPESRNQGLGDWLALREIEKPGLLISNISFSTQARLYMEVVSRTPVDLPIVCVAAAVWKSGRVRFALGGYGKAPILVSDGSDKELPELAIDNAHSHFKQSYNSTTYYLKITNVLIQRLLSAINQRKAVING